jgi:hypothetical protein
VSESTAVSPTPDEVEAYIRRVEKESGRLAKVREVIRSGQGRPIYAVTLTDPSAKDADKQHAMIVAGQHGNEESGRIIALALIDWLVGAGRKVLRGQKLVVMPCVNPDGAMLDIYGTPGGILPNHDHPPAGATIPEGIAVEQVARELQPEVFVDVHARGGAGYSHDMVLYPAPRPYTEDHNIFHTIALEMAAAGERAGIPNIVHPLSWPGWIGSDDVNFPSTMCFAYRRFKAIPIITETSEHNQVSPPVALRVRAGMARLKALLAWGERRHPCLYYPGYPCYLAAGMFHAGVVAVGKTAAARRASRVGIWENVDAWRTLAAETPERPASKKTIGEYDGQPLPHGAGIQVRAVGRMRLKSVAFNGRKLRPSETDGYYSWQDRCSTFVVVARPKFAPGHYEIAMEFGEPDTTKKNKDSREP